MITKLHRSGSRPRTAVVRAGICLRRLAAALVAVTCGLLAVVAVGPAAFARPVPPPGGSFTTSVASAASATVRVVSTGGMAGWQIALIAIGAAWVAAAAAIFLDRALAGRHGATATSALCATARTDGGHQPRSPDRPGTPWAMRALVKRRQPGRTAAAVAGGGR